ncbi:MAG: molecular chaperone HscC [Alphaproteobacteria bacterium PA4]|nr:MAG: molecular chaperone HscC [Alphaproteobacteria bacterium PA4]
MIIGIDLGTTNSAAAIWRDGEAVLIPNRLGESLTPSAVSIDGDTVSVGRAARERQATHPDATITAFKRLMGTAKVTRLGRRDFSPEELSALVLRSLKEDAEAFLGEPVTEAVITVPAYFNDRQRKATRRAGELAGLTVERLVNEPTAAALAYGIHNLADQSQFLVFDLGGGTFDVSVLEIFEGIIEVRASTGDNRLGGEDFNQVLIAAMEAKHGESWGRKARSDRALHERLREAAERTRRALTSSNSATISVIWQEQSYSLDIGAEDFETLAADLISRLREPVLRSLRDSNIRPEALTEIILIGGSTRMPVVRKAVARMFGRFPNASINPDEAVALGAAVQAGLKARDAALREVVLTDVCPYSLGVDISQQLNGNYREEGVFAPIIERNTAVPVSRVGTFQTIAPNQKVVEFGIYQGEARLVADNIKIGSIEVKMPRGPAGLPVECRFSYDINGLLEVDVHVPASGERRQLVITDPEDDVPPAELERRRAALAALKVHPRDGEANRATLARAERCWQDGLGDKRDYVGQLIAGFQGALETQDPRIAERARLELEEALDALEGDRFL